MRVQTFNRDRVPGDKIILYIFIIGKFYFLYIKFIWMIYTYNIGNNSSKYKNPIFKKLVLKKHKVFLLYICFLALQKNCCFYQKKSLINLACPCVSMVTDTQYSDSENVCMYKVN